MHATPGSKPPPLARAACIKDLSHKTVTITLNQVGATDPFPATSGSWQSGTAPPQQFNNASKTSLAPAVNQRERYSIGLHTNGEPINRAVYANNITFLFMRLPIAAISCNLAIWLEKVVTIIFLPLRSRESNAFSKRCFACCSEGVCSSSSA